MVDTPQKGLHKTMGIYEGTSEDQYDDMFPQQIVLLFFSSSHLNSLNVLRGSYFEYIITQLSPFPAQKSGCQDVLFS